MFKTLTRCSTTRSWHGCLWSISLVRIYTFTHIRVVQGTRAQNMLPRQCLDKAWFQISTWSKVAKKGELLDREEMGGRWWKYPFNPIAQMKQHLSANFLGGVWPQIFMLGSFFFLFFNLFQNEQSDIYTKRTILLLNTLPNYQNMI